MSSASKKIPETNQDKEHILEKIRCFALDMDGTIYLGEKWIDGAREFLEKIEESGRTYVFLTNNSSKNAEAYVEKLRRMGWEAGPEKIITSGQATIFCLKKNFAGKKVFLLGNALLREEFTQAGIVLEEETPDVVVTAFDTSLDYRKMCRVCDFVRAGLPYLATLRTITARPKRDSFPTPERYRHLSMRRLSAGRTALSENRIGTSSTI